MKFGAASFSINIAGKAPVNLINPIGSVLPEWSYTRRWFSTVFIISTISNGLLITSSAQSIFDDFILGCVESTITGMCLIDFVFLMALQRMVPSGVGFTMSRIIASGFSFRWSVQHLLDRCTTFS